MEDMFKDEADYVLIELCRIEIWEKRRIMEKNKVLIELCRIEIAEARGPVFVDTEGLNWTI